MTACPGKILIVDDDSDSVTYIGSLIRSHGLEPVTAGSMEEGLREVRKSPPLCVILNCMMCGEDGICFYRALKTDQAFRKVPVIMISSIRRDTILRSGVLSTAQADQTIPEPEAFLANPPDAEALILAVEKLTSRPESAPGR
ncbi:MAG: response regulator [Desulfobacterales bacterium]